VLTGGKDSQLILLANKLNDARWNVFSAAPNTPIVKKWMGDNNIRVKSLYEHDNRNEETDQDLIDKIAAGDLFSNPKHMRWLPTLKKLATSLGGKCFFWAGTMGDALMASHIFHRGSLEDFYSTVFSRCVSWQGNSHQVHKNFTGFSCLSPYHSKEIWENIFLNYDYTTLERGVDLRDSIGEKLAGRSVYWSAENPSPSPYVYEKNVDLYKEYVRYIRAALLHK
jgi:hypothetical protein